MTKPGIWVLTSVTPPTEDKDLDPGAPQGLHHPGAGEPSPSPDPPRLFCLFFWAYICSPGTLGHTPSSHFGSTPDLPGLTKGTEGPTSSMSPFGAAPKSL